LREVFLCPKVIALITTKKKWFLVSATRPPLVGLGLVICALVLIFMRRRITQISVSLKLVFVATLKGFIHIIGNYLNLFVLIAIPLSVHSVLTTSGGLVFSALLGIILKEKPTFRTILSLLTAIVAITLAVM
jgi:glucose uptake protein GlcU